MGFDGSGDAVPALHPLSRELTASLKRVLRNSSFLIYLLQLCHAKDWVATEFRALARVRMYQARADLRVVSGGIAITLRFRFLSATNSLSFRFYRAGKGTLGIDLRSLVVVPIPCKY